MKKDITWTQRSDLMVKYVIAGLILMLGVMASASLFWPLAAACLAGQVFCFGMVMYHGVGSCRLQTRDYAEQTAKYGYVQNAHR